jgi:hypothetical protein
MLGWAVVDLEVQRHYRQMLDRILCGNVLSLSTRMPVQIVLFPSCRCDLEGRVGHLAGCAEIVEMGC